MDAGKTAVGVLKRPAETGAGATLAPSKPQEDVPIGPGAGIMAVMATTRAMRHLSPDPLPDDLVRSIIEAATWAPSGGNWQTAAYIVVTERETMSRLAVLWGGVIEEFRLVMEATGLEGGSDPSTTKIRASIDYQRDHFAEIPALIVVCADRSVIGRRPESTAHVLWRIARRVGWRHAISLGMAWNRAGSRGEGASIYPAVENLLLAARAHGLAACLTSWHLLAEQEFKDVLGIPKDVTTWAIIPIGWPLRRFGPVRRRPVDEVVHRERW